MKLFAQHDWRFLTILALTILSADLSAQGGGKSIGEADSKAIRLLVEQLKSNDFKTREHAAKELSKLDKPPDALRDAVKSGDLEMKRRAEAILSVINAGIEERAFQALIKDLNKIELDRFVRRMVTNPKFADDKAWQVIETLAKAVTKKANELGERKYPVPDFEFKTLPMADMAVERVGFTGKRMLLDNYNQSITSIHGSVVLSTGTLPWVTGFSNSIIIADGDVVGATGIDNCLLIVSGKLGRFTSIRDSIILVVGEFGVKDQFANNGDLRGATSCRNSFIQAKNETIRFTGCSDSVFIKTIPTDPKANRILDTDRGPLQLLKFATKKPIPDQQLQWGKGVGGLAIAIAPDDRPNSYLIRWKNIGNDILEIPLTRGDIESNERNDLWQNVFVKSADGKLLSPRQPRFRGAGLPNRVHTITLEPGKSYDESMELGYYVVPPMEKGNFQLFVALDNTGAQFTPKKGARFWVGKIQSNEIEITFSK